MDTNLVQREVLEDNEKGNQITKSSSGNDSVEQQKGQMAVVLLRMEHKSGEKGSRSKRFMQKRTVFRFAAVLQKQLYKVMETQTKKQQRAEKDAVYMLLRNKAIG